MSRHLFRLFALSLALPEDYFEALMTHPGGIARLIRYPPSTNPKPLSAQNEDEEIGLGAHTDYECFTLLLQDSNPGLEILSPDGHCRCWERTPFPILACLMIFSSANTSLPETTPFEYLLTPPLPQGSVRNQ